MTNLSLKDRPVFCKDTYTVSIADYRVLYNPLGHGEIVVTDSNTLSKLAILDGKTELSKVVSEELTLTTLETFLQKDFLRIGNEVHKPRRAKTLACWLHVTNDCNLACPYCYICKSKEIMSLATAQSVIDSMVFTCKIYDYDSIHIKFGGGEPLLCMDLIKNVMDYAETVCQKNGIGISYGLITNATLMTKEIAQFLYNNKARVGVSLDGTRQTHNLTRPYENGRGSFDDVMAGIAILKDSHVPVSVSMVVSRNNVDDLVEFAKLCLDHGLKFRFSLEKDIGYGQMDLSKYEDEVLGGLLKCYEWLEANLPYDSILSIHQFGDVQFYRPRNRCCSACKDFFAVDHYGSIASCGLGLAQPFGELPDDSLDIKALLDSQAKDLSNFSITQVSECNDCYWRCSCAGSCPWQTKAAFGSLSMKSPFCNIYKAVLPLIVRIRGLQMIRRYELQKEEEGK
jgi:uncharacterized protein